MEEKNNLKEILRIGNKIQVLWGTKQDADGNNIDDIREIHITEASLRDLPELTECLNKFGESGSESTNMFSNEQIDYAAKIIKISTRKMHPELTIDNIKDYFSLTELADAISAVLEINKFFQKMQAITDKMTLPIK
jgi:hypothetical protein